MKALLCTAPCVVKHWKQLDATAISDSTSHAAAKITNKGQTWHNLPPGCFLAALHGVVQLMMLAVQHEPVADIKANIARERITRWKPRWHL